MSNINFSSYQELKAQTPDVLIKLITEAANTLEKSNKKATEAQEKRNEYRNHVMKLYEEKTKELSAQIEKLYEEKEKIFNGLQDDKLEDFNGVSFTDLEKKYTEKNNIYATDVKHFARLHFVCGKNKQEQKWIIKALIDMATNHPDKATELMKTATTFAGFDRRCLPADLFDDFDGDDGLPF